MMDYVDRNVPVLARMFEKRMRGYRAMGYKVGALHMNQGHPSRRFIRKAGEDHSMRATLITAALENGASLEDVREAVGHAGLGGFWRRG